MTYCMVLVTCEAESQAKNLAKNLVRNKLAACAQIHPVTSVYTWEDKVHTDPEFRLVIKTKSDLYKELENYIVRHHDYEVPQILKVPIENGLEPYLNWIDQNTK
ncbi:MAG: divalent-cation tolerance protein CutA [Desulfobacterales bacterium]|nr:divalent-cation tolerance protein CutA [Desulfobacterales bacterium]